jgi:glycosyltransferase involved in cell wall biosynthesis
MKGIRNMRILFAGNMVGSMRAQNEIKTIGEMVATGNGAVSVDFWSPNSYLITKKYNNIVLKGLKYIYNRSTFILRRIDLFLKYLVSDIVFVLPMNHHTATSILWLKKFINRRIIVDFYVSTYTTYLDRNSSNLKLSKMKKYKCIDRFILKNADMVIHPCDYEIVDLCNKIDIDYTAINLQVIPMLAVDRGICIEKWDHPVFRIAWWGIWIPLHGLEAIIHACNILKGWDIPFELNLYGNENADRFVYIDLINNLGLNDVIHVYTDITFSNGRLESLLKNDCDLALGHFGSSDKAKVVCPNKVFDALTMGLAVLTQYNNAMKEFFGDADFIYYSDTNPKNIASAIMNIIHDKKYLSVNIKARNYMLEHFSEKITERKLMDVMNTVISHKQ